VFLAVSEFTSKRKKGEYLEGTIDAGKGKNLETKNYGGTGRGKRKKKPRLK